MTKDEVIQHLCATVGLVYRVNSEGADASDCFCSTTQKEPFAHDGETLKYVRQAVLRALRDDGVSEIEIQNYTEKYF